MSDETPLGHTIKLMEWEASLKAENEHLKTAYAYGIEQRNALWKERNQLVERVHKHAREIEELKAALRPLLEYFLTGSAKVPFGKMLEDAHHVLEEK